MAIIAVLISLLLPALNSARRKARETKDRTQLSQIHKAWFAWASDQKGRLPTPAGLPSTNQRSVHSRTWRERNDLNTTANMHSVLVAENYYDTEILVSPTEQNANVIVKDDYNYAVLNPNPTGIGPIFWDHSMAANLDSECNISYASTPSWASGNVKSGRTLAIQTSASSAPVAPVWAGHPGNRAPFLKRI